ncbi:MAG: hypothetical protein B7Z55_10955, partial [Planctomycetales bacterium 12-60-4]
MAAGGTSAAYLAGLREAAPLREPQSRRYNVEVFAVEPANLVELVSAFGTAEASKHVVISAQVSGEVIAVHPQLKVGTLVQPDALVISGTGDEVRTPGDILVEIDPRTYEERVIQVNSRV